ncbi:MAG: aminotransferase class I/II-fold pyridoxal phosphate-dependent enzyme [Phycisphaerales bacterium]|nr:aminotransferase class I/II-fold pyridoxal phosphate-dependent enzyme [Phycisphaerales bacterium]
MGHSHTNIHKNPISADSICLSRGLDVADGDPLVSPLVQSTTFCRSGVGSNPEHQYSRVSNPTVANLEKLLGDLEGGLPAATFATGLAAETALFLALLKSGDHIVCGRSVYGGTTRLIQQLLTDLGVKSTFVNASNPEEVRSAVCTDTKLIFVETPSNPTLDITDIKACSEIAKDAGVLLAVDNTFLTPVLQRPLDFGADISVYSTTKFIDGHSIALGGALVVKDETLLERLKFIRKCTGAIQSPFNAWLTINGIKTLPLRVRSQSKSAAIVADWLNRQPQVESVFYPSLTSGELKVIADRQHINGHGAVVSFTLKDGFDAGCAFVQSLKLCTLVEHVGSVETLITHPASMTHADVPRDQRLDAGISDGLLRLSVGLEDINELIADLKTGLSIIESLNGSSNSVTSTSPKECEVISV